MRCPSCGYIQFRPAKKCPSCNGGLARAQFAPEPDEEFSVFAGTSATMGTMEMGSGGYMDMDDLGGSEVGTAVMEPESDVGPDDFELDLSDAMAPAGVAGVPLEAPAPAEAETMNFDLGTSDVTGFEMDHLNFDLDTAAEPGLDLGTEPEIAAEPELNLDLGSETEAGGIELDLGDTAGDAGIELNLDEEPAAEGEIALDLGNEEPGLELSLDEAPATDEIQLDLEGDTPAPAAEAEAEPSLDLDGLELDLEMDTGEEDKPA